MREKEREIGGWGRKRGRQEGVGGRKRGREGGGWEKERETGGGRKRGRQPYVKIDIDIQKDRKRSSLSRGCSPQLDLLEPSGCFGVSFHIFVVVGVIIALSFFL